MKTAKLWIGRREMDCLISKIMARMESIDIKPSSPCAGITRDNCETYVLAAVKKEIERYGQRPDADLQDVERAFIFGLPLNDTVFMLAGCAYPEAFSPPTVDCELMHDAGTAESYCVEFYHSITA